MDILVAEDNEALRRTLAGQLALVPGVRRVRQAVDGIDALSTIEQEAPDLLVLDLHMPRLGGMLVLKQLRARQVGFPIVVLTAYAEYGPHALAAGAQYFFDKVISTEQLFALVTRLAAASSRANG